MTKTSTTRSIPFGRPQITDDDRRAVAAVLDGHVLTHGPECAAFEAEFAGMMGTDDAHCVAVSSGMAALHLAYIHFGIGPGDEVIVPAMTHIATVHAVEWVGATPVFVDCDPATGNVTREGIEAALTGRTKALSVVHFQGIPCDMPEIMATAQRHNLRVVEDCALAVGSRYEGRHAGLFGDAACFSFYPVKHITCAEGGMFVTRHAEVAQSVAKLRAFGVDRRHDERSVPGMYDVPMLGLNYRMSELQAALGRSQLSRLEENLAIRRRNFEALKRGLSVNLNVRILDSTSAKARSGHYGLSLVLEGDLKTHRNEIIRRLGQIGIGASVYYPQPTPRMKYYREKYGYDAARYPVAAEIADCSIALPVGPHVTAEDVDFIVEQLGLILCETQS
jgi:dTDP-4-amino-4,6-dideoxygalactose transaminase